MVSPRHLRGLLRNGLGLQARERLLIVTDESAESTAEATWKEALRISHQAVFTKFCCQNGQKYGLPQAVAHLLGHSDAALVFSRHVLLASIFDKALHRGARVLVLYNSCEGQLERSLRTPYEGISYQSRRLADIFTIGKRLHLSAPNGTEAIFEIARIKGRAETAYSLKAGELAFLPAGEACVQFAKAHVNGQLAFDRLAGEKQPLSETVWLSVKEGQIKQIRGGDGAGKLRKTLRRMGSEGRLVSELGVGTNHRVQFGHSAQEDEKVCGTVHVCVGHDMLTRGQNKLIESVKGIVLKPTIRIDGRLIMEEGQIVV